MDKQADWAEREQRFVEKRRQALPENARVEKHAPCFGLALSGGGIRSATFSLGFAQGLAKAGAFLRFDYLSTVSGGGYTGLFLRSLFLPPALRGKADAAGLSKGKCRQQAEWGLRVLCSNANEVAIAPAGQEVAEPEAASLVTNPVYWLREHSRYLTPNGAGDFLYALAYLTRNWLAMQYVWFITLLPLVLLLHLVMIAVVIGVGSIHLLDPVLLWLSATGISPLFVLPLLAALPVAAGMVAYWLTEPLKGQSRIADLRAAGIVAIATLVPAVLAMVLFWYFYGRLPWLAGALVLLAGVCFVAVVLFQVFLRRAYRNEGHSPAYELGELRRRMTKTLATFLTIFIGAFAVALIDQLGLELYGALTGKSLVPAASLTTGIALLPAVIWLIRNVPQWLGSEHPGRVAAAARRSSKIVLPVVGVALYAFLAVCLVTLAYFILWQGERVQVFDAGWLGGTQNNWNPALVVFILSGILAILTGCSPGFLNLSSLHNFYSARLIRAYLGATNLCRLKAHHELRGGQSASRVTDTHPHDGIDVQAYLRQPVAGPLHLINVTVNETVSPGDALTQRDRKGVNLCVGPLGVSVAGTTVEWEKLGRKGEAGNAEAISLGGWCAISGAAMGTGMGRTTSLGSALLTTFANVRLGYWWNARAVAATSRRAEKKPWSLVETQSYLWDEMRSHFMRAPGRRLHLSDGGHFDNTAIYELLRRQVPVIVACDNGADPHYRFQDFSSLVRTARLDFGTRITVLTRQQIKALPGFPQRLLYRFGSIEDFRSADLPDWPDLCAMLCQIDYTSSAGQRRGWMVVAKPRPIQVAVDVDHYACANPDFPQQTTGDQFF